MDDVGGRFQRINECILRIKGRSVAGLDPLLMQLQGDVLALRQSYETTINATATHEQKVADLKKRLEELASPPLVHALLIGPSAREPDTFVVSVGGQRMDVKAASTDGGELHLERLREGTEVLVTRESTAIVGVVGPGQRGDAAEVRDVLDDAVTGKPNRLLVRWGGTDGIVVDMAQSLRTQGEDEAGELPKAGDRVLIDPSARMAFEKLKPESASEAELETDPHDTYEDIAGLDEKIESIRDAIELPYIHRALFERYQLEPPKGILLHGPPGCGKTMIGRAVANGLKKRIVDQIDALIARIRALPDVPADDRDAVRTAIVDEAHQMSVAVDLSKPQQAVARLETAKHDVCSYFLNIKGPELLSKWVGEAEHRIRRLFAEARRKASYRQPVIVFFDEIESMFQRRGSGVSSDMEKTMVPQLLTELDGLERLQNVVVIGASNRHELLDPALLRPGRLDVKIKIDRPDRAGAAAIFRRYLQPPGSHQLKLSPHGLLDSSRSAFDGEIGQIIKSLGEAATFVRVQRDRGEPALARLDVALPADLFDEVAAALRGGNAGYRDGAIKTRIGYADLSRAIGAVCRTHSARLVAERRLPADVKAIDVMFRLDAIDAIERHRFPPLPFVSAGAVDAGDSQALAALLIDISVDALFSPRSQLKARVIAKCGREHSFLLREFVSGALISNIVSRAKRSALKRATRPDSPDGGDGITSQDLLLAVREEYEENKDQFVANKPEVATTICEVCKREHSGADEYDIEVVLGRSPRSRWHEPRRPPHERGRPSQVAEAVGGTR